MNRSLAAGLACFLYGCSPSSTSNQVGESLSGGQNTGAATDAGTASAGESTAAASASTDATATGPRDTGTAGTSNNSTSGPTDDGGTVLFDVGSRTDMGTTEVVNAIPSTCREASEGVSSVGCTFFGVDLDQSGQGGGFVGLETGQYAIVVSNPQDDVPATVVVEQKIEGAWQQVDTSVVAPLTLHPFLLEDLHHQSSGTLVGGAYRVTSDVPIVAYQFNPLAPDFASTDASVLYPVSSWDYLNRALHWGASPGPSNGNGYLTIAAAFDGTQIQVTPTVAIAAADDSSTPAAAAGETVSITLDEGDIVELMVAVEDTSLVGTLVESLDPTRPVAVFSGHECAQVPDGVTYCDHLEEQLTGVRLWGTHFVGARMPVRRDPMDGLPESSLWQIVASENNTAVTLNAHADVTGLPPSPIMLNAGDFVEFYAAGTQDNPGDLFISADHPIAVANLMTSSSNIMPEPRLGDPALVQISPVEQYLPQYVVLVATGWDNDYLVITRPTGAPVLIDDVMVPNNQFIAVGNSYEVGRIRVFDGPHRVESTVGVMVTVVGYDSADSYAYQGGTGTAVINPNPPG